MLQETQDAPAPAAADEPSPHGEAPADADNFAPGNDAATPAGDSVANPSDAVAVQDNGSALETLVGVDLFKDRGADLLAWVQAQMLTVDLAIQGAILIAALAPAALFGPRLKRFINNQIAPRAPYGILRRGANAFAYVATPIALLATLQIAVMSLQGFGRSTALTEAGVSLLTAWIVIRLVTLVIRSPFWSRIAFYLVWPLAALDAFGVLDDVVRQLDAFSFPIGDDGAGNVQRFSALDFIRMLAIFGILFWAASLASGFLKGRIAIIDELTVSFKALLGKILDILLPIVALVAALQVVGFPFGTLAIFGGAVGLGVGLGMQRTVSNFFAGFTLIADKSIKPGDVIEVNDTFGWVTQMNARYVSLRTRDGTAHLVPNDKFIEEGVINWSHSDRVVRLKAKFSVTYAAEDLRAIAARAEEIALGVDRVVDSPAPRCNLMEFGDSSINFELRFWINDPANGASNVRSDVLLTIWDMLKEMNIEIPFPQRDLHIKSMPPELATARESNKTDLKSTT